MEASSEVPEKTEYFLLEASLDCQPPTVQVGTPLLDAIALMSSVARGGSPVLPQGGSEPVSRRSSYVLVTENEQLVGILTERDVVRLAAQGADFSACLVDAVMTRQLITLKPSDLKHPAIALNLFRQHRIRHIPVVDGQGHWVGMVTPDSIRQNLQSVDLLRLLRIEESMSKQVVKALPTATVLDLARLMAAHRVSCVVIQQAGPPPQRNPMPVGIVTERDVVQFQALGLNLSALEAQAVMSTPLVCLQPNDTLWTAHESMQRLHVRRLVITDEQGILAGIVTQTSILAALDPLEMQHTIAILHQQVEQLKDERVQWLQTQTRQLENQVADSEQRFQAIFNQTFQFAGLLQLDGTVIEANQTALDFGGLQLEDVIGHPFWEAYWWTISPETQAQLRAAIAQAAQGEFIRYEVEVLGVGQVATIDFSLQPICDGNGQVKWLLPEGRDISDRKQAEMDLRESKQRYANLSQAAPVGIFQTDAEGNCLYVNDRWCQMAGMPPENARGTGWIQGIHPDDRELVFAEWYRATQAKDPFILEYRFQNSEGEVRWVLGMAVAELGADGNPSGYIGTTTDITARVQAEQDLFREKELAQITLHSIADAVITTDALGRVEYFNPVAEQLTGWDAAQAQGQPLGEVFHILHEITRQPAQNPVERALREGCVTGLANHTVLIARDGTEYSIEDSAAPIRDRDGQIIGAIMVFHDVTQSRELQYQLSWQASHDVLTDLPNRRYFEQQLGELLKNIRPCQHVLIYLDLDRFKVVNDTCGHIAGDELLRQIARLLSNQVRATDTLARLGGDEFGILLQQCSLSQAQSLAEKIRVAIQEFRFVWQDKTFSIGASIGLALLDTATATMPEILSAADNACYAAKHLGRNRIHVYQANDYALLKQRGEGQWSLRIQQALEDDRFCLHRQAIADTTHAEQAPPLYYEVLLRMIDKENNLVAPGLFIPAAERFDLMKEIDCWVVKTFFDYLEETLQPLSQAGATLPLHFINLSGASIGDNQFLGFLKQQFGQYHIDPQTIGFEITETAAIANLEQATRFIKEIKQLGCPFALDDFGSGMSSFGYLKNLQVDYLKIDGNFVKDTAADPTNRAIVEAINHIGHVMGLRTIAESVETPELRHILSRMGVDYVQGYGIGQPSPIC